MATRNYEGKKFENEAINKIVNALTIEEALQININDTSFTASMSIPGEDASFYDFLYSAASSEPSVTLPLL